MEDEAREGDTREVRQVKEGLGRGRRDECRRMRNLICTEMACLKIVAGNLDPWTKRSGGLRTKQAGRGSCCGS
ncbi:hypothetical protein Fmac_014352 [Flemingia macrophylla]|uniref:Uncharacterized protein n=1 Tax=Flemingia macrophylla TaxID=520843 RepID=A0ABD1MBI4_9FABA